MTPALFLLMMLGGGLGAATRFVVDGIVMRRVRSGYPWGTFVINVTGSLVLGVLTGLADSAVLQAPWLFVLGGGFLGGYTTFSTAMVDVVALSKDGRRGRAIATAAGMLVVTVLVALAGVLVGRAL